jgi:hypothetical protein
MRCPKDGSELLERRYEADIFVDLCPSCGGIWLDESKLEAVEYARQRDYSEELDQPPDLGYNAFELARSRADAPLYCPTCSLEMERREYARCSQVLIDVCPHCGGIWLDKGELAAIEIFFEREEKEAREVHQGFFASLKQILGK